MMSENLVSKPMSEEDTYGSRMFPVTVKQDTSMENILMESQGPLNYNSNQPQLFMSDIEGPQSQQLRVDSQEKSEAQYGVKPLDHMSTQTDMQKVLVPNWPVKQMQALETNPGEQKLFLPNKRKASSELISKDPVTKKVAQMSPLFNYSVMPPVAVPNIKVVPKGSGLNSPRLATPNKKKHLADNVVNRSQPLAQRNQNARVNAPNKAESASSSVRSKLKESLAAALALVLQEHEDSSSAEKKDSSLAGSKKLGDSQTPKCAPDTGIVSSPDPGKSGEPAATTLVCPTESSSATTDPKHDAADPVETWKFVGQEFQSNPVLSYDDAPFSDGFFGKDELLMGNGLTWAMELDIDIADAKEGEENKKVKLGMHLDAGKCKEPLPSPELVATEIEAELFKLFGGVNKKYKEKGRSLMFNLKDKSNPELRESVLSGKIPPEKLCSMSAEELASKELSEWRIAKTEEFDHMKVLPDTDVDLRRLVKKTHKGEFQIVEVERDVSVPVDIEVVSSTPYVDQPQDNRVKDKHSRAESPVQADKTKVKEEGSSGKKSNNGEPDSQCQLTIPSDAADVMHGLMVDDIKDLPPIVSLDEFMESLDKEPPFENLQGESGTLPGPGKETSDAGCSAGSSDQSSKNPEKKTEQKSGEMDSKSIISNGNVKSSSVGKGREIYPVSGLIKGERVWEGLLQLSISSMANFVGIFKSGEKTSTKDWTRFFEIKGRVRLDAFQRFLQDLPMSRSRAVMVVHFALAEECTEDDHKNLKELVDSYVVDQRLGFAEPASGFEIYFIPPQTPTLDMLSKLLTEEYTKTLKMIDNGLIGVVVWRKAHVTPPTTTHHKDNPKRQQHQPHSSSIGSKQKDSSLNTNVNFASKSVTSPSVMSRSGPNNFNVVDDDDNDDDDDDVPPGFGPPTSQNDDDDLPEFKFSGPASFNTAAVPQQLTSPTPSRSVDQVRQLIQKYGKPENGNGGGGGGGIALQPWDDDDDDDIPEWQPEAAPAQPQALPPPNIQQPLMPPKGGGGGAAGWWRGGAPNGQQRQWRSDGSRSRGGRGRGRRRGY